METIETLNERIEAYLSRNPSVESSFVLQTVPTPVRELVGEILPKKNIDAWIVDKNAFNGKSALELISELGSDQLRVNVDKLYQAVVEALAYQSVPKLTTPDKLYQSVRESQYNQLGL